MIAILFFVSSKINLIVDPKNKHNSKIALNPL